MGLYRKKPVIIEAHQLEPLSLEWIANWCGSKAVGAHTLRIATLEGAMTVRMGDWVIKGVAGEFYPCKQDIFEATYERVNGFGERLGI